MVGTGRSVEKPALPLAQVLDQCNAPTVLDYGAFDMEGSELEVLSVFPFDRYRFRALSLECDRSINADIARLMAAHGYREVKNPFNRDRPWECYWLHPTEL